MESDYPAQHRYQTRSKSNKSKRKIYQHESSDDDNEFIYESTKIDDNKSDSNNIEKDPEPKDFQELLLQLFPSKYQNNKLNKFNKNKKIKKSNTLPEDNFIILNMNKQDLDSSDEDDDNTDEEEEEEEDYSDEDDSMSEASDDLSNLSPAEIKKYEKILEKFQDLADKLIKKNKESKLLKSIQKDHKYKQKLLQKSLLKSEKKKRKENKKKLYEILNDKKTIQEDQYFSKELTIEEQTSVIEKITEIKNYFNIEKPYLITLTEKEIPNQFKAIALNKINTLKQMSYDRSSSEYNKLKNWVDAFIKIPFNEYHKLPVNLDDGIEKSNSFITNAKLELDKCVFGLNDAKLQILQLLGTWIVNPEAIGSAIAIHGPMGTGKTSLVRDGISKILGRPFAFIPLGGATDSSTLEGHGYTYEGSTYGKIVDILIQSKTMNPIIMFDELDKVSDTPKGEEIIGILTHLTDSTQNSEFHDKYFSEISFNLSKCLFIFSYNDESKINPILKDRLYKIQTQGYTKSDKITIANDYLIPNIRNIVKLNSEELIITNEVINNIIDKYTNNEKGVRNLKRNLEIIFTKVNLLRLLKNDNDILKDQVKITPSFPLTIDTENMEKLIIKPQSDQPPFGMYT
jgi:ATP-dependent Lon protease